MAASARPRAHRLLTVPGAQPRIWAASSTEYPSISTSTRAACWSGFNAPSRGHHSALLLDFHRILDQRRAHPAPPIEVLRHKRSWCRVTRVVNASDLRQRARAIVRRLGTESPSASPRSSHYLDLVNAAAVARPLLRQRGQVHQDVPRGHILLGGQRRRSACSGLGGHRTPALVGAHRRLRGL